MIFDWLRSRAALLGELCEVRELAAEYATDLVQARVDLRAARAEQDLLEAKLKAAEQRISGLEDTIGSLGEMDRSVRGPAPRTPSAELLAEKARADALEARLDVLQRANMAADWR